MYHSLSESTEAPLDNSIHDLAIPDKVHEAFFVFLVVFLLFDLTIPDKVHEAVIHPGGGDAVEHLDVHKVEVLGAASVVQVKSDYVDMVKNADKSMLLIRKIYLCK